MLYQDEKGLYHVFGIHEEATEGYKKIDQSTLIPAYRDDPVLQRLFGKYPDMRYLSPFEIFMSEEWQYERMSS
jgi:hypothetical protein